MANTLIGVGILCVIAALVGGGLSLWGNKIPVIPSWQRQVALGLFGIVLIALSFFPAIRSNLGGNTAAHAANPPSSNNGIAVATTIQPPEKHDCPDSSVNRWWISEEQTVTSDQIVGPFTATSHVNRASCDPHCPQDFHGDPYDFVYNPPLAGQFFKNPHRSCSGVGCPFDDPTIVGPILQANGSMKMHVGSRSKDADYTVSADVFSKVSTVSRTESPKIPVAFGKEFTVQLDDVGDPILNITSPAGIISLSQGRLNSGDTQVSWVKQTTSPQKIDGATIYTLKLDRLGCN